MGKLKRSVKNRTIIFQNTADVTLNVTEMLRLLLGYLLGKCFDILKTHHFLSENSALALKVTRKVFSKPLDWLLMAAGI